MEYGQFQSINQELEMKFKNKIEVLQSQIQNLENRENELNHQIINLRDQNRVLGQKNYRFVNEDQSSNDKALIQSLEIRNRKLENELTQIELKHRQDRSQLDKTISEKNQLLDNVGKNDNKFYELKMKNYLDEIAALKLENQKLKDQLAKVKTAGDGNEVTLLKEKIIALEKKVATYEKLVDKNSKLKKRGDTESEFSNNNSVFNLQTTKESSQFYHESFQAKKGYDTSSMEKFANSIPNIPDLVKKSPEDLQSLCLSKVEWSTAKNSLQAATL